MKLAHIKNLLKISQNFNTTTIVHSFSIGMEDVLTVKCLTETFIFEITSTQSSNAEYYVSIDQAAEALFEKINSQIKE